jgi:hypothetical protein
MSKKENKKEYISISPSTAKKNKRPHRDLFGPRKKGVLLGLKDLFLQEKGFHLNADHNLRRVASYPG